MHKIKTSRTEHLEQHRSLNQNDQHLHLHLLTTIIFSI
jgi:hypothetical protein